MGSPDEEKKVKGEAEGSGGPKKTVAWDESSNPPQKRSRFSKFKKYFGHIGIFLGLIVYTAAGAWVFMALESEEGNKRKNETHHELHRARSKLKDGIILGVKNTFGYEFIDELNSTLEEHLREYEKVIDDVLENDLWLFLNQTNVEDIHLPLEWNYPQSAFFASTVVSTIGYGNMAPETNAGRIFCILFALIGIPFTLTVIADLGKGLASMLNYLYKKIRKQFPHKGTSSTSKLSKKFGKSATVGGTVLILLLYIAAGGALFPLFENWGFFESFYFSFITMTTIGFGDVVPKNTNYMIVFILYIMIGLALTSTAIELVRIQYADSWRKMRELSTRLQGLSGPLADTLRKYGDNINLDVNVLQDLKDLKKVLALSSGKMKRDGSIWKNFWENQDGFDMDIVESNEPKLIQITIYESTV